jgi:hypothetical protein
MRTSGMASIPLSPAVIRAAPRILQIAVDLERNGKLAEVGGIAYLVECVDAAEAARQPGETIEDVALQAAHDLVAFRKRTPKRGG